MERSIGTNMWEFLGFDLPFTKQDIHHFAFNFFDQGCCNNDASSISSNHDSATCICWSCSHLDICNHKRRYFVRLEWSLGKRYAYVCSFTGIFARNSTRYHVSLAVCWLVSWSVGNAFAFTAFSASPPLPNRTSLLLPCIAPCLNLLLCV